MKKIKEKIRTVVSRLLSVDGKPQKVAFGYALGIFLATTPFVGIKVPIAMAISQIFKWKKVAAIIGVFHINSLTGPFFYAFSFFLGKNIMGYDCSFLFPEHLGFQTMLACFIGSKDIFISLLVGGLIIGIPMSFVAYKLTMVNIIKRKAISLQA